MSSVSDNTRHCLPLDSNWLSQLIGVQFHCGSRPLPECHHTCLHGSGCCPAASFVYQQSLSWEPSRCNRQLKALKTLEEQASADCPGTRDMPKSWRSSQRWLLAVAVLFVCIAVVTFIMALIFDYLFTKLMLKQLTILPDSLVYKSWQKPSVPVFFSFYAFNLTNPSGVLSGDKPVFQEIGPFVYREARDRINVVFSNETPPETVSFKQRVLHYYIPEHSVADPATVYITTVNLMYFALKSTNMAFFAGFMDPFVNISVSDLAWGYTPGILSLCPSCPEKIGLFFEKNGTSAEPLIIKTGVTDIRSIGQIVAVGNKRKMDVWDYEAANVIQGTDGSVAAPGLTIGSKFHIFVPALCRSVTTYGVGMANALNREEIELLAFSGLPPESEAAAARESDRLFCKSNVCPPQGLIAVEPCMKQNGNSLPLFLCSPHFFNVDPAVSSGVEGLSQPDKLKHSTWMRIEPNTGFVLEASQRMQFNLFVEPDNMRLSSVTKPFYFPMVWMSEEAAADRDSLNTLYDKLLWPKKVIPIILAVICVVSSVLAIACLVLLSVGGRFFSRRSSRKANAAAHARDDGHLADGDLKTAYPIDDHLRGCSAVLPSSKLHSQVPEAKPLLNPTENGNGLSA